jgi:3-oxoacyl-[acyl-carrier protein] reductase
MKRIDFSGQRILVTGGTRGIGKKIVDDIRDLGGEVHLTGTSSGDHIRADFLDPDFDLSGFLLMISNLEFDVVINNAGTNKIAPLDEYLLSDWDNILMLNLTIPFMIIKAVSPGMKKRGYGRIVNITSISSQISMPLRSAYCSSKFGLNGLTKVAAVELAAYNVLVNSVGPGVTRTELTEKVLGISKMNEISSNVPIGRLADVDDISNVVLFTASKLNSYMTGQNILVDGGYTCV